MSSANEQLVPPPPLPPPPSQTTGSKPRLSPLDFRNTDLVSRLLAATPPYLYNMSLLPNTYFFSEMLRSFVQAKTASAATTTTDPTSRSALSFQSRRTRKRPWTSSAAKEQASYQKTSPKSEQNDWNSSAAKPMYIDQPKAPVSIENSSPLELTTSSKLENESRKSQTLHDTIFPNIHHHHHHHQQDNSNAGLILPPPPPIWYPPLYPAAPYGIDPLHFFIDLRVSGHIYDRKNNQRDHPEQEASTSSSSKSPTEPAVSNDNGVMAIKDPSVMFKQSRHASAFSVPTPHHQHFPVKKSSNNNNNLPINLSHNDSSLGDGGSEVKNLKFAIETMMVPEKNDSNRIGTNYIMNNIGNIYKNLGREHQIHQQRQQQQVKEETGSDENESDEQREKRVRDLRALIGLELVVDYMNHAKPQQVKRMQDETTTTTATTTNSSTDLESMGSPNVEVVALHDDT